MTLDSNAPDALALLGASTLRVRILQAALATDEVTATELMDTLGATRNGIGTHLTELTTAGYLIERRATHPRGSGGIIYWRADRDRIGAALWHLTGTILGYQTP